MIVVWPDGQWCWQSELSQHSDKSDDYQLISVPDWCDEDDAQNLADEFKRAGKVDAAAYFGL